MLSMIPEVARSVSQHPRETTASLHARVTVVVIFTRIDNEAAELLAHLMDTS